MIGGFADMLKWSSILGLTSSSGPIPPEFIPPAGNFTPSVVLFNHVSAATGVSGTYLGNVNEAGGVIDVSQSLLVTSDGSGDICELTIATPLHANFTSTSQAIATSDPQIIIQGQQDTPGNIGTGTGTNLLSNTSGSGAIDFYFEGALPNTQYLINMSYKYTIQSTAFIDPDFYTREFSPLLKQRTNLEALKKLEKLRDEILSKTVSKK
jgi:hypothetical protein